MLHSDYFRYECVQKTPISEEAGDETLRELVKEPVLVVLICCEKKDEEAPLKVAEKAVEAILDIAKRVKASTLVLHPFAHLSDELSSPNLARIIINEMKNILNSKEDYKVLKTPFGWREILELRVKSHPISKVYRKVIPE
ncbi:MAG: threonyl-tRNA synthetase editing domain-containing protein [Candidatus Bathyarchaeia archaeon]